MSPKKWTHCLLSQVLSDPRLREQYDSSGKDNLDEVDIMEGKTFFSMIFGSADFEPLVGKFKLTSTMSDENMGPQEAKFRQLLRQIT